MGLAPGRDRAVFRSGNREPRARVVIELAQQHQGGDIIRSLKVDQVSGPADGGLFRAGHSSETKVMQLEVDQGRIAGFGEVIQNDMLHRPALRGDGRRIPDLDQQRFQVIRQPERVGIGIFHRHQDIRFPDHQTFGDRLDFNGQPPLMLVEDVLPTGAMKDLSAEVGIEQFFCLIDFVLSHDGAHEILLEPVLQAKKRRLRVNSPGPGLKVRVNPRRVRRILFVVADFVAVRQPADIVDPIHPGPLFSFDFRSKRVTSSRASREYDPELVFLPGRAGTGDCFSESDGDRVGAKTV